MNTIKTFTLVMLLVLFGTFGAYAQNFPGVTGATPVQGTTPYYSMIPIGATTATGSQTTLTIPAPPAGLYNYVCFIHVHLDQTSTTVVSAGTITSTNFNGWISGASLIGTASTNYDQTWPLGTPATGCAKSFSPQTATTFLGPSLIAGVKQTIDAFYYQAP